MIHDYLIGLCCVIPERSKTMTSIPYKLIPKGKSCDFFKSKNQQTCMACTIEKMDQYLGRR